MELEPGEHYATGTRSHHQVNWIEGSTEHYAVELASSYTSDYQLSGWTGGPLGVDPWFRRAVTTYTYDTYGALIRRGAASRDPGSS